MVFPSVLKARIEALLFASDRPLSIEKLFEVLEGDPKNSPTSDEIRAAVAALEREYENRAGGFHLIQTASGVEFRTRQRFADVVLRLYEKRPAALSQPALETLSIVAYRQPCSRALVDRLRGVDSSSSLRTLVQRGLVSLAGRSKEPGRPYLYKTTKEFLRVYGLQTLTDLPRAHERSEMAEPHVLRLADYEHRRPKSEQEPE